MLAQRVVKVMLVVIFLLLLSPSSVASANCQTQFFGFVVGDFIFETLPDNIGCIATQEIPRVIDVVDVDGFWHLVYVNEHGEAQAQKYLCTDITSKYKSCEIWDILMPEYLHAMVPLNSNG